MNPFAWQFHFLNFFFALITGHLLRTQKKLASKWYSELTSMFVTAKNGPDFQNKNAKFLWWQTQSIYSGSFPFRHWWRVNTRSHPPKWLLLLLLLLPPGAADGGAAPDLTVFRMLWIDGSGGGAAAAAETSRPPSVAVGTSSLIPVEAFHINSVSLFESGEASPPSSAAGVVMQHSPPKWSHNFYIYIYIIIINYYYYIIIIYYSGFFFKAWLLD